MPSHPHPPTPSLPMKQEREELRVRGKQTATSCFCYLKWPTTQAMQTNTLTLARVAPPNYKVNKHAAWHFISNTFCIFVSLTCAISRGWEKHTSHIPEAINQLFSLKHGVWYLIRLDIHLSSPDISISLYLKWLLLVSKKWRWFFWIPKCTNTACLCVPWFCPSGLSWIR